MIHPYLAQGPQTKFTDRVYEHAERCKNTKIEIESLPEPLISIHKTCKHIYDNIYNQPFVDQYGNRKEKNQRLKDIIFRKRDIDQILKEGCFPTCSDVGILFRGLMVAQGHPTAYVETFDAKKIHLNTLSTHSFARVYFADTSVLVNPNIPNVNPIISDNEVGILPYIICKEGLDSWDIGVRGYDDLKRMKYENLEMIVEKYKKFTEQINRQ